MEIVGAYAIPTPALTKGPVWFAVSEQLIQRGAGILLIKLLAIIGTAGIPAVATQGRVMARHAQLIHRDIHRLKQSLRLSLTSIMVFGVGRGKRRDEQEDQENETPHRNSRVYRALLSRVPLEARRLCRRWS